MTFFAFTCILVAVLSILLGILVFSRNPRGVVNRTWFLVTLSIFAWAMGFFGVVLSETQHWALVWQYLLDAGGIFIPVTYLHFVLVLLDKHKTNRRNYLIQCWLFYAAAFIILALSFLPIFKQGMEPILGFHYWVNPGPLYIIFPIFFALLIFYSLFLLFKNYPSSVGYKRGQIRYVAIALIVGFGGGITNFLPQLIKVYPFGHFFIALYVIFITYAITRYRLMDIKTIIKKSTVFAVLVVAIGAIFVTLSNFVAYLVDIALRGNQYSEIISTVIVSIIIAAVFLPLRNMLETLTDRFLFTRAYNQSDLLSKINQTVSSTIDLSKLLKLVAGDLEEVFHYSKIGFALINKNKLGQQLKIYYQSGFEAKALEAFSKGKIDVLPWYFSENKEIKVIDELKARYEAHEYQPKSTDLLFGLYEMNISLVIPLFVKDLLIGIIVLGSKKSDDPYNDDDLKTLSIIAGQLGIAVENARLYEQQKNFNIHLKDEVKKATAELEAANKELKRLDDAKSEFLSIASHQLRTPLTITKGYVSMMNEGSFGKVPKIIKENLDKIYAANERLLNLVENLLDISRIEAGRLEFDIQPVDLVETVKALVADFQEKAKVKKLKLEFYPEPNLPKCAADPEKIKEVISNLIDNSIKYTPKGEVIVGIHTEGQSLVFSCQDTGMGIEPEDLPRLFNKFVRGKGMMTVHTEGTGLGLYFARVVIENMGGRIWTESPGKNKGSKFSFSLPLADKTQATKIKSETIKNPA